MKEYVEGGQVAAIDEVVKGELERAREDLLIEVDGEEEPLGGCLQVYPTAHEGLRINRRSD
jgi:hypothetical protein